MLRPGPQSTSNGNFETNRTVANLGVVPVDTDGRFCVLNQSGVELIADVQGYVAPATRGGLAYVPGAGSRVLDTRRTPSAKPAAGSITHVAVGAAGASAVLVNITMIGATAAGYVTADACAPLHPGEQAFSNGNYGVATAGSNLAFVPVDPDGGFCVFTQRSVDLAIDVVGAFVGSSPAGLGFDPLTLARALDTRVVPGTRPAAGMITRVATGAPPGTAAVLANIAMVDAAGPGYITAGACSVLKPGEQARSTGNFAADATASNLSVVNVDPDGSFCIYNQLPVDMTVDIQGAFSPMGTQHFFPTAPSRAVDTRPPTPTTPTTSCTSVVHIGDSTSVGLISPSIIADPALRMEAQYRRVGVLEPRMEISGARSIVETLKNQINAYDVAAATKAAGYHGCWVFALGTTDTANIAAGSGPGRLARIQKMMDLVAGDPVMWVTAKSYVAGGPWSAANMQLWNVALAQAAPSYPNLRIYDWSAVADRAWFSSDLVHYTVEGYTIRARLIADALAVLWPG